MEFEKYFNNLPRRKQKTVCNLIKDNSRSLEAGKNFGTIKFLIKARV